MTLLERAIYGFLDAGYSINALYNEINAIVDDYLLEEALLEYDLAQFDLAQFEESLQKESDDE